MNVKLLSSTPDPEYAILWGYLNCQTKSENIPAKMREQEPEERFKRIFKDGHFSVLEHASASVVISGVSRSLLAQITRHRLFSYSVRSMRAVPVSPEEIVIPPTVKEIGLEDIFLHAVTETHNAYSVMVDSGVPLEDARFTLPIGTKTEILMTGNFRNWIHFLRERTGVKGKPQWEIKEVAQQIWTLLGKISPNVFSTDHVNSWE